MTDEEREILDNADPEAVKQAFVEALREDDGAALRGILKRLRESSDPEAKDLYARFILNPALRDLIPH